MAEKHDGDERRELPPDLDLEEPKSARPAGHERDDDREADQGHHSGLPVAEFANGSADKDEPTV